MAVSVSFDERFDVVVIGGGHAGCEAAVATAKMGLKTALLTMNLDLIAQMSCNPAIGGIAKGHLVREIDALGGVMGQVIDRTGIQFRLLNTSRGPAVWSPRAQADKQRYRLEMRRVLEQQPNLIMKQAEVVDLILELDGQVKRASELPFEPCFISHRIEEFLRHTRPKLPEKRMILRGLELMDSRTIECQAAILTTGTFLNGEIHVGEKIYSAGRSGEPPSHALAEAIKRIGFTMGRLKTGTPPRLDGRTIDYSKAEDQPGDEDPTPFSFRTRELALPQVSCHIVYTNEETHRIIRNNISRSPLYSGQIHSIGPRYCPSIEDKVVKFADKERHQIFLEPEGLDTYEVYVNGLSTSMPVDVQKEMVHSIPALRHAELIRPGYAIEYDFVQPIELHATMETKRVAGLYHAGQINGTTGYEEAAGQGVVAGINAGLKIRGLPALVLDRMQAYLGIMVDDLITKGTNEPYRMFTSRAEYRLHLRIDNADLRLTEQGYRAGTVSDAEFRQFCYKRERVAFFKSAMRGQDVPTASLIGDIIRAKLQGQPGGRKMSLAHALKKPEISIKEIVSHLKTFFGLTDQHASEPEVQALLSAAVELKYEGYMNQQQQDIERMRRARNRAIPEDFNYEKISGLSREMIEKLSLVKPRTLDQASRIPGVTPAAVQIINIFLEINRRQSRAQFA